ncbi:acetyltransferase [Lutibacter flavus]|uniref:Sugar O-acyltransferase, sialic acid O-acetyltransferase NeuD family n=1 Tax=Lutibacter flavus TaxID=691689 RepID=A0A238YZV9_9FLAO|nr:acetyltransferase [Lutibacter flavus]SNR76221.1 sugar O-acyltransferase, sialic acid O-acetyltransferase NeuD family [Lutibacter flavus]
MYLYGASGHCKVIIDSIESSTDKIIKGVFDDNIEIDKILNVPIYNFETFDKTKIHEMFISVGNNATRKMISESISENYISVFHPKATISKYAFIDEGSCVMANAVINASAKIGKHCIVNTGAIVEHDCELGDFVHISPNASLAGNVKIGEGTHIGIGAQIIQGITIGKWVTIGAGTVVIRDIPDGSLYVGNPARQIKK